MIGKQGDGGTGGGREKGSGKLGDGGTGSSTEEFSGEFAALTSQVIGACIEVHRELGPGLLESAYDRCLQHELNLRRIPFLTQVPVPVGYKGLTLENGYRIDVLVAGIVIVEIKAVEQVLRVHEAQVITYLRLTELPVALLVNFNSETLIAGLRRFTRTPR